MAPGQEGNSSPPTQYSQWFILVTAISITCLITANITAVKLVSVFGLIVPAAIDRVLCHRHSRTAAVRIEESVRVTR